MTRHPAAYLRRSYVDANAPGDISLESQRVAVKRLAAKDGHNGDIQEYSDWGISADVAKSAKRTAYARLLSDMEAGAVSAVYAFDVDRLYRDPRDLIRLQDAAHRHDVRIVTTSGPLAIGEGDDPLAEGFAFVGAVFARMELQKAKKRARAAREVRKARGDAFGHPRLGYVHVKDDAGRIVAVKDPDANLEPIRQAMRDAGTVLGATKLLNARKIPTVRTAKGRGEHRWSLSMVHRTIIHHWPELLPPTGASGKRIRASSVLSQLVKCPCGNVMTPNNVRRQLYCSRAVVVGRAQHGRYNVTQAPIIEWCKREVARLRLPFDAIELEQTTSRRRDTLSEERDRLGVAVVKGMLSPEAAERLQADIDAELVGLKAQESIIDIPQAIDWDWEPAAINTVLRALWVDVQLDADMQPVRATWRVPEWRA